jgi:hypothetical protein
MLPSGLPGPVAAAPARAALPPGHTLGGGFGAAAAAAAAAAALSGFGGGGFGGGGGGFGGFGGGHHGGPPGRGEHPNQATRQARRLYVGNMPPDAREDEIRAFFSKAMATAHPNLPPGDSAISVYLNLEKKFGFVEFRTMEEASSALHLDGIMFR